MARILLLYGIIFSIGGLPLLYLGDEVGMLNDYSFSAHPEHASDSRWVHRPFRDWEQEAQVLRQPESAEARTHAGIRHRLQLRRSLPLLAQGQTEFLSVQNDHVFAFQRKQGAHSLLMLNNFTERPQAVAANELRLHGFSSEVQDLLTSQTLSVSGGLMLAPYQALWLQS